MHDGNCKIAVVLVVIRILDLDRSSKILWNITLTTVPKWERFENYSEMCEAARDNMKIRN